jgi:pantoate--beta-alanine ligase
MQVIYTAESLDKEVSYYRGQNKSIGFVPTMGALHHGHLSLIAESEKDNHITICSIFVNPNQFNNKEDLKKYPRTPEKDLALLKNSGCDIAFLPEEEDIYPEPDSRRFDFGILETVMEGYYRPGHFNGVAQVVSRLFIMVKPHRAYFGEKDFQQLAVIRALVKKVDSPVEIVACATVREADGLAMSSRNLLLSPEERKSASLIPLVLRRTKNRKHLKPSEARDLAVKEIESEPLLKLEYFEIVDAESLVPVKNWMDSSSPVACIALYAGKVRLIDNMRL